MVKTFDLALKHLKGLDFSNPDIFADRELISRHENYRDDKLNTFSNDHYRGTVFYVCIYHLHDLALNKVSMFYVALEIIESLIDQDLQEKYLQTSYPNIMVNTWNEYCNSMESAPDYLSVDNEIRFQIFCVAYHYVTD